MQLLPSPASKVRSTALAEAADPTLPIILEFQSPSTAIINTPTPRAARHISWLISSMVMLMVAAAFWIRVDRVVSTPGRVIAQAATLVVQPLETSIVRTIEVHEGQAVHAGQILARALHQSLAAPGDAPMSIAVPLVQAARVVASDMHDGAAAAA